MSRVDYDEAMAVLRRGPVLAACRDEPRSRREIADAADCSRTTAYRTTTELVEAGLLAEANGAYETTVSGTALVAAADRFRGTVDTVDRLEPLLAIVDHPELVEHAHLFGDVEVVVADAENPYRVVERSVERLGRTTSSVGTLANATAVEAIRQSESMVPEMAAFERILTEPALEAHSSIGTDVFDDVVADESIDLLVAPDDTVPFSFAIDDHDVSIVGHDPSTGLPTVHVESSEPGAREWLQGLYERCKDQARPV